MRSPALAWAVWLQRLNFLKTAWPKYEVRWLNSNVTDQMRAVPLALRKRKWTNSGRRLSCCPTMRRASWATPSVPWSFHPRHRHVYPSSRGSQTRMYTHPRWASCVTPQAVGCWRPLCHIRLVALWTLFATWFRAILPRRSCIISPYRRQCWCTSLVCFVASLSHRCVHDDRATARWRVAFRSVDSLEPCLVPMSTTLCIMCTLCIMYCS